MHKIRLKTNERNTKRNSLKCGWGMKGLLTGTLAVAMSVSLWLHGGSSAYASASHGWFMSIGENSINATCDQECRSENPHKATLDISVEDFTYPGNAVGKSEIFKATNFTEFNKTTGKNVSVDNIKVYKSKDGEKRNLITKEEQETLLKGYEKINKIGIPFTEYNSGHKIF